MEAHYTLVTTKVKKHAGRAVLSTTEVLLTALTNEAQEAIIILGNRKTREKIKRAIKELSTSGELDQADQRSANRIKLPPIITSKPVMLDGTLRREEIYD